MGDARGFAYRSGYSSEVATATGRYSIKALSRATMNWRAATRVADWDVHKIAASPVD
jgi:hypothetical protein